MNTIANVASLPVTSLSGVGPSMEERLARCGIHTIQDLLFHLPYRYQDRTRITPIIQSRVGDHAVIHGKITQAVLRPGRKASLVCTLADNTGEIRLRFFHFNSFQRQQLQPGTEWRCFGEVRFSSQGKEMVHPEYQPVIEGQVLEVDDHLTPLYPSTAGLQQRRWQRLTEQALELLHSQAGLTDYLHEQSLPDSWPDLVSALQFIHRPPPDAPVQQLLDGRHPAQQRLAFEELLAQQLAVRRVRLSIQDHQAVSIPPSTKTVPQLIKNLPFALTNAQQRVLQDIQQDLALPKPMLRLVQGDVGSGKTIVAALAALQVIEAGFQVALMAPTEILAEQHFQQFQQWFSALQIPVGWLSGKVKAKDRREVLTGLAAGDLPIVIGTHALFQEDVIFDKLALAIIDEQHRFGVQQRLALREKGALSHQLIMTATPIPRTLAMTAYADLDISTIDELPPGRQPIKTVIISNDRRDDVIQRLRDACRSGRQAYWVCTLIEESEVLQCQAAEKTAEFLQNTLTDLKIGLVHGRLSSIEKAAVMHAFATNEIQLLVATTVIEVGVNVPNSTLMVIENPERLGLAQLHQLRGRVGRGSEASFCLLLYQSPLSYTSKSRLQILRDTTDGFIIARHDLELRGPGEVLGTCQTGLAKLRIADLLRDQALLPEVQRVSAEIEKNTPDLIDRIIQRWLGDSEKYAHS